MMKINNAGFNILRKRRALGHSSTLTVSQRKALYGGWNEQHSAQISFTDNAASTGVTYIYAIQSVSTIGETRNSNTVAAIVGAPKDYALYQNFPNPFNPSTTIQYDLDQPSTVTLEIYIFLGQVVLSNNRGLLSAGKYSETVDMNRLATGAYYLE